MLWVLAVGACAPADPPDPDPEPSFRFARPLQGYRDLELITGPADFPAIADAVTLAGPADSTLLLFGLSLPTSALRFRREERGFVARYVVSLRAARDRQVVTRVDRRETVRVQGFAETLRTDESVLFQAAMTLPPGEYTLTARVRDGLSARGFRAVDTIRVPDYGADGQRLAAPALVHQGRARHRRDATPEVILNPRRTVPYGGPPSRVYLEAYGSATVNLEIRGPAGAVVWSRTVPLSRGTGLAAGTATLPVDSLPLGRFSMIVSAGSDTAGPVPFTVALTDEWLAANFIEVLGLLRYIAGEDELKALLEASAGERRRLWDEFWEARDPVPATPANEYRDTFFERVRMATIEFAESGRPGWKTDRGEVYIVLGPPSRLTELRYDAMVSGGKSMAQEWVYARAPGGGRLSLVFVDRTGFGGYRLTQDSEVTFRAVARRLKDPDHQ